MAAKPLVLITGGAGQLGTEFSNRAHAWTDLDVQVLSRHALDITDRKGVMETLFRLKPQYLINAAAYTAVDRAESDSDAAFRINRDGAANLASACAIQGCSLLHISTDYVFDGQATSPYPTDHPTHPINVYGASKLAGEEAVMNELPGAAVIRTSWLYAAHGQNFLNTMRRLMTDRPALKVVSDQMGVPTYTGHLTEACIEMIRQGVHTGGIFHFSNAGPTSWHGFAQSIGRRISYTGDILPIPTAEYPTPAKRPMYSVMDTSRLTAVYGIAPAHWEAGLDAAMQH